VVSCSWPWQDVVFHDWHIVVIEREIVNNKDENGSVRQFFNIRMNGRSQEPLRKLIAQAQKAVDSETVQKIYSYGQHGWRVAARKEPRPLSTIILKDGQMDRIVNDMRWFMRNQQYYRHRGIPYHRGYLLEGPPGTGKTSIIAALAHALNRPVAILNLSSVSSDESLFNAVNYAPKGAIIAIEDVDAASGAVEIRNSETKVLSKGKTSITLAGLLNVLDGSLTPDGTIFVMTTNHPELIDPALIRPGRCDLREVFGYMDEIQQKRMSGLFYDTPISVKAMVSPAQMQGILIQYPNDPQKAVEALEAL
jgi:chaperone BCS1